MKLSVVIPARNEERLLPHCLRALAHQRRPADEIIVVDNGSTDHTSRLAARYGATVLSESKLGIFIAAARGYNFATGDVIARLDADSVPGPDWLGRIEAAFLAPHAPVAVTGPGRFQSAGTTLAKLLDYSYMRPYFRLVGLALQRPPLFGSNFAMAQTAWQQAKSTAHIDHPRLHDDIDLSYHLPSGRVLYLDELAVVISPRPFRSLRAMLRRIVAGFWSIFIHWPNQAPWNIQLDREKAAAKSLH